MIPALCGKRPAPLSPAASGFMKYEVETWPIDRVRPYPGNPRDNAGAVDACVRSISEFGWRQPLVCTEDGELVVGHTRLLAARKLGLADVPVHVARGLTPDQVRAYRIADNQIGAIASWDSDRLAQEVLALQESGVDLVVLGFDDARIAEILAPQVSTALTHEDDVPPAPLKPRSRRGDLAVLGDHRVLCGDSASVEDLDRLLDGAKIHLVNTDPPYNVKVEPRSNNAIAAGLYSFNEPVKKAGTFGHQQSADLNRYPNSSKPTHKKLRAKDRPLANDFVSDDEFDRLLAAWFGNIARVLVPGGAFYIWGGYANCANYPPAMVAAKLYFAHAIIWVKEHPVLTRKDFMGNHEWCFYGWREGAGHKFYGPKNVPDVWKISRSGPEPESVALGAGLRVTSVGGDSIDLVPSDDRRKLPSVDGSASDIYVRTAPLDTWSVKKVNPQSMVHLTEKPVELARRAIEYSSRPGQNVLDLFGGSGSTLIGCERTGRRAFLMELDPGYMDVIIERYAQHVGGAKPVVVERDGWRMTYEEWSALEPASA